MERSVIMNDQLQAFARQTLKEGLAKCTEGQQNMFKRMYSHDNKDLDIDAVVNKVPIDRLDWAMQQVQTTLDKK